MTKLGSIGDPMSELNIQRRFRFFAESDARGIIKVSEESFKADPAVRKAVRELDHVQLRKPRE